MTVFIIFDHSYYNKVLLKHVKNIFEIKNSLH